MKHSLFISPIKVYSGVVTKLFVCRFRWDVTVRAAQTIETILNLTSNCVFSVYNYWIIHNCLKLRSVLMSQTNNAQNKVYSGLQVRITVMKNSLTYVNSYNLYDFV